MAASLQSNSKQKRPLSNDRHPTEALCRAACEVQVPLRAEVTPPSLRSAQKCADCRQAIRNVCITPNATLLFRAGALVGRADKVIE